MMNLGVIRYFLDLSRHFIDKSILSGFVDLIYNW